MSESTCSLRSYAASEPPERLLVVDDDPHLLDSLCPLLKYRGFDVDAVPDGRAACRKTRAKAYDLILLDIRMPGMSGFQVMTWLSKAEVDIPVVLLSGVSAFDTVRKGLRKGAYDYVRKPYDLDELESTVRSAIRKRRAERARLEAERAQRLSEAFYRQAVDSLPDLVFGLDRHGRFNYLNRGVEPLLGYHRDSLIGKHFREVLDAADVDKAYQMFERAQGWTSVPVTREVRLKSAGSARADRDYEVKTLALTGAPLCPPGQSGKDRPPAMVFGVARDITERKKADAAMSYKASHDLLTRLPNRTLFRDRLVLAISRAKRHEQRLAVMFLDLNRFKRVNDTLGHSVGDKLLQIVARRLKSCLREGDTLSRFGGDEFTLLLPDIKTQDDAGAIARKLIDVLRKPFHINGAEVSVGVSIGIAVYPDAGLCPDDLIRNADTAMYEIKRWGEDSFQFFR